MSRWIEQFESHPFQAVWASLKESLNETKVDDETVITAVQELARLKKVIAFVDGMISTLDPELVPLSTWDTFNNQATPCYQQIMNFNNTRNFGHITNANANADNLVAYIRPYMIADGKAGKVLQESVTQYAKTVEKFIESFHEKSSEVLSSINTDKVAIDALKNNIEGIDEQVNGFKEKLFGSEDQEECIENKIDLLVEDFEQKHSDIVGFHDETLIGNESNPSTKKLLTEAKLKVLSDQESVDEVLGSVTEEVKELKGFYIKIFGKLNDEDERQGGLSNELSLRMKTLREFEEKQITKYEALNEQIESLLPGATSAGLATAYKELKDSFNKPIKNANTLFFVSIGLLVFASVVLAIKNIGGEHWIEFVEFYNWDTVLKGLVYKIPFYAPVLWLAFFATKRRSEYQRLQQEYAHKESLAKSYDNYKKQIELLDDDDKSMQGQFIMKAVDAIAYNASQTLDGKHGDNHPAHELLGKVLDTVTDIKQAVTKGYP